MWRELPQPEWLKGDLSVLNDVAALRAALDTYRPDAAVQVAPANRNSSAVLISTFADYDGARVILTRRSQHLNTHQGQIAFPGGRVELGETPFEAALRESREEIGLDTSQVRLLGELQAHHTVSSNSHIVPYVAELVEPPRQYVASTEVDRVFSVPLADLARADTFVEEHWVFADREVTVPAFYLDDETVWGATARMLRDLIVLMVHASR
jgi:8-oxo-dGTP pyrophosphatase MutT (NUDIX family)